jgi:hypothetical protein
MLCSHKLTSGIFSLYWVNIAQLCAFAIHLLHFPTSLHLTKEKMDLNMQPETKIHSQHMKNVKQNLHVCGDMIKEKVRSNAH